MLEFQRLQRLDILKGYNSLCLDTKTAKIHSKNTRFDAERGSIDNGRRNNEDNKTA